MLVFIRRSKRIFLAHAVVDFGRDYVIELFLRDVVSIFRAAECRFSDSMRIGYRPCQSSVKIIQIFHNHSLQSERPRPNPSKTDFAHLFHDQTRKVHPKLRFYAHAPYRLYIFEMHRRRLRINSEAMTQSTFAFRENNRVNLRIIFTRSASLKSVVSGQCAYNLKFSERIVSNCFWHPA